MSIPSKMRPTGFDSWYVRLYRDLLQLLGSPEKFVLDWIAPEKKLVIHTDRVDDTVLTEVAAIAAELVPVEVDIVQYNHDIRISWQQLLASEECTTWRQVLEVMPELLEVEEMSLVLPKLEQSLSISSDFFKNENLRLEVTLPQKTWWGYVLKQAPISDVVLNFPNATKIEIAMKQNSTINSITINAPKAIKTSQSFRQDGVPPQNREIALTLNAPEAESLYNDFGELGNAGLMTVYAPKCTSINKLVRLGRDGKYPPNPRFNFTLGDVTNAELAFHDCYGVPDGDFPAEWPFLKYGNDMFTGCRHGKELAIRILNSLQTATAETGTNIWRLTMGIHIDHQNDPEVLEAISNAEAKGWTLTVQWNPGGPTYTTPTT